MSTTATAPPAPGPSASRAACAACGSRGSLSPPRTRRLLCDGCWMAAGSDEERLRLCSSKAAVSPPSGGFSLGDKEDPNGGPCLKGKDKGYVGALETATATAASTLLRGEGPGEGNVRPGEAGEAAEALLDEGAISWEAPELETARELLGCTEVHARRVVAAWLDIGEHAGERLAAGERRVMLYACRFCADRIGLPGKDGIRAKLASRVLGDVERLSRLLGRGWVRLEEEATPRADPRTGRTFPRGTKLWEPLVPAEHPAEREFGDDVGVPDDAAVLVGARDAEGGTLAAAVDDAVPALGDRPAADGAGGGPARDADVPGEDRAVEQRDRGVRGGDDEAAVLVRGEVIMRGAEGVAVGGGVPVAAGHGAGDTRGVGHRGPPSGERYGVDPPSSVGGADPDLRARLLDLLTDGGRLSLEQLVLALGADGETLRRELGALEEETLIVGWRDRPHAPVRWTVRKYRRDVIR